MFKWKNLNSNSHIKIICKVQLLIEWLEFLVLDLKCIQAVAKCMWCMVQQNRKVSFPQKSYCFQVIKQYSCNVANTVSSPLLIRPLPIKDHQYKTTLNQRSSIWDHSQPKTINMKPLSTKDHQYETTPNQRPPILSGQISEQI